MKKILPFGILLFLISAVACADDRPVPAESLPQGAKDFISNTFPNTEIKFVVADKSDFEVMLADGTEIDFDKRGNWENVKNRNSVPGSILPAMACDYINASYPDINIVEIDKDWNGYEVKLMNNLEIWFGKDGKFLRMDYDD